ncbi:MAG: isopentenyl-diphosphate Delta-isomerase [Thermoanaerobaculales bacterium]|nr:isopentenyl-diphosphate Delta-isomerase [Thermoanaerobaculales bacterium]
MAERSPNQITEVVSSEDEMLILVDESDRVVGHLSKGACHDGEGVLHRAFSLFVFNRDGELLLQRRSPGKRLWPLFWSNSCCSHPRESETMDEAIHRRLHQELRMSSDLQFLYKFQYQASYEDVGSENEFCWVYIGVTGDEARPNPNEVEDHRWVTPAGLDEEMSATPEVFTPWFQKEWQRVREADISALAL